MQKTFFIILIVLMIVTSGHSIQKAENIKINVKEQSLPESFTWQNIDGIDYTTGIKDQNPAPTCEAYAFCASIETILQYNAGELYDPDLSETHLYFYAGGTYRAGYVNMIDAANYLVEKGVPDEGCYPDPHRAFDYPFLSLDGWENRAVKISEWGWVENDEESIKTALIEHGPLVFFAYFWRDFFSYEKGVYKHRWGRFAGGHVMTIVGYDDNEQCWIVKNSWGKDWGLDGWLKMSYDANMITDDWYKEYDENCTGIMYLDGVYGNTRPDVPEVYIQTPSFSKTYIFGKEISTILKRIMVYDVYAARVIGNLEIKVTAENADKVEFYIDGLRSHVDHEAPYNWDLETTRGRHTLMVKATKGKNESLDILDFYKII